MNYKNQAIAGMNRVELVVALYDGMVKFLHQAARAIESGDDLARRMAIKRVLDILMHLQSRLRMDIGGAPAKALSEFYAAVFALAIEGSRLKSRERLAEAIGCIRNVREAWRQVALDPEVLRVLDGGGAGAAHRSEARHGAPTPAAYAWPAAQASSWTA